MADDNGTYIDGGEEWNRAQSFFNVAVGSTVEIYNFGISIGGGLLAADLGAGGLFSLSASASFTGYLATQSVAAGYTVLGTTRVHCTASAVEAKLALVEADLNAHCLRAAHQAAILRNLENAVQRSQARLTSAAAKVQVMSAASKSVENTLQKISANGSSTVLTGDESTALQHYEQIVSNRSNYSLSSSCSGQRVLGVYATSRNQAGMMVHSQTVASTSAPLVTFS